MTIQRRLIARAGALSLAAATLASCSDSSGPLELDPIQFESMGESIAAEIESSVFQLTAGSAMEGVGSPALALRARLARTAPARPGFQLQGLPMGASGECGVPSQNPPTDTDEDGVPDNLTVTFALPACHVEDIDGSMDLTGAMRISDPLPGTAGLAMNLALDQLRIAISGSEIDGTVIRDGLASVAATATGLSQTEQWTTTARLQGFPAVSMGVDWTATFATAPGSSIVAGQPLPDGFYSPSGTFSYSEGNRAATFSVTTLEPLQYSSSCAQGVVEGWNWTPFLEGQIEVAFSDAGRSGSVIVTYSGCNFATAEYVAE
jgi:hypothetical protein